MGLSSIIRLFKFSIAQPHIVSKQNHCTVHIILPFPVDHSRCKEVFNLSNMTRGPKKHLKRLAAPKSWMLDKLGGVFTVRPSSGPHKLSESMPITLFLRNRLKYALNKKEVETILKQRLVKIDGKVRTDPKFPCGFMDVVQIEKNSENFRLIYDVKGRSVI